jgi:hypothetical protein
LQRRADIGGRANENALIRNFMTARVCIVAVGFMEMKPEGVTHSFPITIENLAPRKILMALEGEARSLQNKPSSSTLIHKCHDRQLFL